MNSKRKKTNSFTEPMLICMSKENTKTILSNGKMPKIASLSNYMVRKGNWLSNASKSGGCCTSTLSAVKRLGWIKTLMNWVISSATQKHTSSLDEEMSHSMSQYLSLSLLSFSHTTWKVAHWTFFSGALDVFCCGTMFLLQDYFWPLLNVNKHLALWTFFSGSLDIFH